MFPDWKIRFVLEVVRRAQSLTTEQQICLFPYVGLLLQSTTRLLPQPCKVAVVQEDSYLLLVFECKGNIAECYFPLLSTKEFKICAVQDQVTLTTNTFNSSTPDFRDGRTLTKVEEVLNEALMPLPVEKTKREKEVEDLLPGKPEKHKFGKTLQDKSTKTL